MGLRKLNNARNVFGKRCHVLRVVKTIPCMVDMITLMVFVNFNVSVKVKRWYKFMVSDALTKLSKNYLNLCLEKIILRLVRFTPVVVVQRFKVVIWVFVLRVRMNFHGWLKR